MHHTHTHTHTHTLTHSLKHTCMHSYAHMQTMQICTHIHTQIMHTYHHHTPPCKHMHMHMHDTHKDNVSDTAPALPWAHMSKEYIHTYMHSHHSTHPCAPTLQHTHTTAAMKMTHVSTLKACMHATTTTPCTSDSDSVTQPHMVTMTTPQQTHRHTHTPFLLPESQTAESQEAKRASCWCCPLLWTTHAHRGSEKGGQDVGPQYRRIHCIYRNVYIYI